MKTTVSVILCTVGATLVGCTSTPSVANHEPYVKPGLIMLTADQAERRGLKLETASGDAPASPLPQPVGANAIATPPNIKVYTLNRTVDAADPSMMHEEHVVYRRETSPHWRLDVAAEQKILVGPRVTDGRQELAPLLDKELTTYLADQRRTTDANQQAIAALFKAVEALNRQQQAVVEHELRQSQSQAATGPSPANPNSSASSATDPHD